MRKRASQWGAFFVWRGWLAALLLSAAPAWAQQDCPADRIDERARVTQVVDGDTLRLDDGRLVRFVGINTPEIGREDRPSELFAERARDVLKAWLGPRPIVGLRYDLEPVDHHGRALAHVYTAQGRSLQAFMLEQGLAARVMVPPNLWSQDCYRDIEREARAMGKGVWAEFYRPVAVADMPRDSGGFRIVRGRIERVGEGKRSLWLNFTRLPSEGTREGVALRIDHDDLNYFSTWDPKSLVGREIIVRGWFHPRKGQLVMRLRHPAAVEFEH